MQLGYPTVEPAAAGDPTVAAYLADWLAHARGRVRPRTYQGYESLIRCHAVPDLGERALRTITPLDLQRLYASVLAQHPSGGTALNLHLVLTQALAQAVRWGILASNPASGAQPPRPRRPETAAVDAALLGRLLEGVAGTWVELPAAIAAATGMRRGEVLGLRWADLDDAWSAAQVNRSLQVSGSTLSFEQPKTRRSRRRVALPAFIRPYLERGLADQTARREAAVAGWNEQGLIVCTDEGQPVNPDTLSSAWRRLLRQARMPAVRFHDLRHAHATLMLLQGVHPKVVSERLGHASVGITLDTYSHVLPSMQESAVRAFDELFGAA
jgi:integrase